MCVCAFCGFVCSSLYFARYGCFLHSSFAIFRTHIDRLTLNTFASIRFADRKRRVYDQYGKDGLLNHNNERHNGAHHRAHHRSRGADNGGMRHDAYADYDFVFRSPDEVFREFFGIKSPFGEMFFGECGIGFRTQSKY